MVQYLLRTLANFPTPLIFHWSLPFRQSFKAIFITADKTGFEVKNFKISYHKRQEVLKLHVIRDFSIFTLKSGSFESIDKRKGYLRQLNEKCKVKQLTYFEPAD
jgi:hypothetical protein